MKKIFLLFIVASVIAIVSGGCAARFGDVGEYYGGDWSGRARSGEVGEMEHAKLDLEARRMAQEKLEAEKPQKNKLGYRGVIINNSRYNIEIKIISGPEKGKEFIVGPKKRIEAYLIEGRYRATIKRLRPGREKKLIRMENFLVGLAQHEIILKNLTDKAHWCLVV